MAAIVPVTAALAAQQAGSIGIGFSGAGFLLPFFLGVIDMLYNEVHVLKTSDAVAGASSGSLAALVADGLLPPKLMGDGIIQVAEHCRAHGNCWMKLKGEVTKSTRAAAENVGDAAGLVNRHGKTYIAITFPSPAGDKPAEQRLISRFKDVDDLIAAGEASIYVPFWAGPTFSTTFRGEAAYDGSLAGTGFGYLPCPPNVTYCIRVDSRPINQSLGSYLLNDYITGGKGAAGFAARSVADTLLGSDVAGNLATTLKAYAAGGAPKLKAEAGQLAQLLVVLSQQRTGDMGLDIYPGRRHAMPVGRYIWSGWAGSPPDRAGLHQMYELGRAEALSWAQDAGFPSAKGYTLDKRAGAKLTL